jgi:hypothetical protein
MASTFTWLDHSEDARRRVLDVINIFRQRDTRDELGLGSIRDGFADLLSPGTSTIQTRIRYFLLVPWLYQHVERSSSKQPAASRASAAERDLIEVLLNDAQHDVSGLIGRQARRALKRLPSAVYWQGLQSWGIRSVSVAQDAYHRWIDAGTATTIDISEEGEPTSGIWHSGLLPAPLDFSRSASLTLRPEEGDYLCERLRCQWPDSLLTWLVATDVLVADVEFPWLHPNLPDMPAHIQEQLEHARCFSEALHGAQLLYNLLLARQRDSDDAIEQWHGRLEEWEGRIAQRGDALSSWDLDRFWAIVGESGARVPPVTRQFTMNWIEHVRAGTGSLGVALDKVCEDFVRTQEVRVKGKQARLVNRSLLDSWGGDSGSAQLNYRWGVTSSYVTEIQEARRA